MADRDLLVGERSLQQHALGTLRASRARHIERSALVRTAASQPTALWVLAHCRLKGAGRVL
jgi:hypothetical protein